MRLSSALAVLIVPIASAVCGTAHAGGADADANAEAPPRIAPMCPRPTGRPMAPYMRCTTEGTFVDEGSSLLYCPAARKPHTLVVVASHLHASRWGHDSLARQLTDRGYAVAVVDARWDEWKGGDGPAQLRFAATTYAERIRRVTGELLTKHRRTDDADCVLSGKYALVGIGRGGDAVVFAADQAKARGEAEAGAVVLLAMPPSDALPGRTIQEACDAVLGTACPDLVAPTLLFGTTYLLKPEARVRSSQDFGERALTSEEAHVDVLDDPTNANLSLEEPHGDCVPCRLPEWDGREAARSLVADRIALWVRSHVDRADGDRAASLPRERVTRLRAPVVTPSPEYLQAVAKERAETERRLAEPSIMPLFSLPVVIGGTTRPGPNGGGLAIGARPELIVGSIHTRLTEPHRGFGVGPYLDVTTISGDVSRETLLGGGGTLALYTGDFGLALSGGVDADATRGGALATVGAFIGFRGDHDLGPIDMPVGVRVDGRLGPMDQRSVTIAAQVDVVGMILAADVFTYLFTRR